MIRRIAARQPRLLAEMEYVVPDEILRELGTLVSTRLNRDYWYLEPSRLANITRRLEETGYRVTDGSSLGDWY